MSEGMLLQMLRLQRSYQKAAYGDWEDPTHVVGPGETMAVVGRGKRKEKLLRTAYRDPTTGGVTVSYSRGTEGRVPHQKLDPHQVQARLQQLPHPHQAPLQVGHGRADFGPGPLSSPIKPYTAGKPIVTAQGSPIGQAKPAPAPTPQTATRGRAGSVSATPPSPSAPPQSAPKATAPGPQMADEPRAVAAPAKELGQATFERDRPEHVGRWPHLDEDIKDTWRRHESWERANPEQARSRLRRIARFERRQAARGFFGGARRMTELGHERRIQRVGKAVPLNPPGFTIPNRAVNQPTEKSMNYTLEEALDRLEKGRVRTQGHGELFAHGTRAPSTRQGGSAPTGSSGKKRPRNEGSKAMGSTSAKFRKSQEKKKCASCGIHHHGSACPSCGHMAKGTPVRAMKKCVSCGLAHNGDACPSCGTHVKKAMSGGKCGCCGCKCDGCGCESGKCSKCGCSEKSEKSEKSLVPANRELLVRGLVANIALQKAASLSAGAPPLPTGARGLGGGASVRPPRMPVTGVKRVPGTRQKKVQFTPAAPGYGE